MNRPAQRIRAKLSVPFSVLTCLFAAALGSYGLVGTSLPAHLEAPGTSLQGTSLPPVPEAAQDAYFRALDVSDILIKRPDKAAGSPEWDIVIKRLMEAQSLAPTAPLILWELGQANQLRGRASAAVAWFKATSHAIKNVNPRAPEIGELAKRIAVVGDIPRNLVELGLTLAHEEIPYIHAKKLPHIGPAGDLWPPQAAPPAGPVVVDLGGGQAARNPDLFYKDGTPKPRDLPPGELEESLIKFRLGIGDVAAIEEAEKFFWANGESPDILSASLVRLNAYELCLRAWFDAAAWPEVIRLADEAAAWCQRVRTAWTSGQDERFLEMKRQAQAALAGAGTDMTVRWAELAKELAISDAEILFQAKIDNLRRTTDKGEAFLEGIARAVEPVGLNLMRLRSIED
jgi:hypothetical protein